MSHVPPRHPLQEGIVQCWRPLSSILHHAAGVLSRTQHCSDATAVASRCRKASYGKKNVAASTKPEVHNVSPEEEPQPTATASNVHGKFDELG